MAEAAQARRIQADAAREWVRRALAGVGQATGAPVMRRETWRGSGHTADTVAARQAVGILRAIEMATRGRAREEIAYARAAGMSWQQVGEALGLTDADRDGVWRTAAEAAFDYAAPPDSHWARTYGPSIRWDCPSCGARITDRGPYSGPADAEQGHGHGCQRLAATVAAWEAQQDCH